MAQRHIQQVRCVCGNNGTTAHPASNACSDACMMREEVEGVCVADSCCASNSAPMHLPVVSSGASHPAITPGTFGHHHFFSAFSCPTCFQLFPCAKQCRFAATSSSAQNIVVAPFNFQKSKLKIQSLEPFRFSIDTLCFLFCFLLCKVLPVSPAQNSVVLLLRLRLRKTLSLHLLTFKSQSSKSKA